jgi:ParB-like chromosome segregation protein Spo0J
MKSFYIECGDEKIRTIWKEGAHTVSIEDCIPNDWNMNKVEPRMYEKLMLVIKETRDEAGRIPPITVRPHPHKRKRLQIIDGEHRWKILQELGCLEIDVTVMYVSTLRAMSLTAELNYNRGEPDMEKYPAYLARMMREFEVTPQYLGERLSDSADEIVSYIEASKLDVDDIRFRDDEDEDETRTKDASERDDLVEFKFVARRGAAEVIERELARLKSHLGGGKNERGRAFEMMAVLSSQTPDNSITSTLEVDDDDEDISVKKLRKKVKKKVKPQA